MRRAPVEPPYVRGERPDFLPPRDRECEFRFLSTCKLPPPPDPEGGEVRAVIPRKSGGLTGGRGCGQSPRPFPGGGVRLSPRAPWREGMGGVCITHVRVGAR